MNWHTKFPPESPPNFGRWERESKQASKQLRIFCHFMSPAFLSAGTLASQTGIADQKQACVLEEQTMTEQHRLQSKQQQQTNKDTHAPARARTHTHALSSVALSRSRFRWSVRRRDEDMFFIHFLCSCFMPESFFHSESFYK